MHTLVLVTLSLNNTLELPRFTHFGTHNRGTEV